MHVGSFLNQKGLVDMSVEVTMPTADWPSESAPAPDAARDFCTRHNLTQHVLKAVSLAGNAFAAADQIVVRLERDPESEMEWLAIDTAVKEGDPSTLDSYKRLVGEWLRVAPTEARDLIQFTFHVG
jgi:hypothetical protein